MVAGDRERFLPHLVGGVGRRGAPQHGDPAREGPDAIGQTRRVARHHDHLVERHREPVRDDLGQRRLVGLPLARRAREHEHAPERIDADANALVRAEPGVLDEQREAHTDRAARGARTLALGLEAVGADRCGDAPQALGIVAAVVAPGTVVA